MVSKMDYEERVETTVYVRMDSRGRVNNVTKGRPRLGRDEIAFRLFISVPASVFRSPMFDADVKVREGQVIVPDVQVEIQDDGLAEEEE